MNAAAGFWTKVDTLVAQSAVRIDRPKGSVHHPDFVYPLDYGYLTDTQGGDGDGIDVWIGSLPERALVPEVGRRERLVQEFAGLKTDAPLYGVLVGIKDIFHVAGLETRTGSALPPEILTGPEAACVTALKRVGALVLGKTVTTEFAYFEPGPTRNPHNSAHTPGGSSSGSAAAVAAGFERAGWAGEKWVAIWFAVRGGMAAGRGVARLEQGAG